MAYIEPGTIVEGYEFMDQIGHGGFSHVYRVRSVAFNRVFVAKVTRCKHHNVDCEWKVFDSEIQALVRLNHPNIIKLYGHFRYGDRFVLILEHCPNGSLADLIRNNGAIPVRRLARIAKEVCSAMNYAWDHGVQHRDIKPANIMFDEADRVKIVDFGISIVRNEMEEATSTRVVDWKCSIVCAAPEILEKKPYDPVKGDMWAIGVTIVWMVKGTSPWGSDHRDELLLALKYGWYNLPRNMDPGIETIVKGMLKFNPGERVMPSAADFLNLETQLGVNGNDVGPIPYKRVTSHGIIELQQVKKRVPWTGAVSVVIPDLKNVRRRISRCRGMSVSGA